MEIERTFQNIPEGRKGEADQPAYLVSLGWSKATRWQELLRSKRVLIISEAGAGKTYECQSQQQRLWNAGEPAFYLELATLAKSDLHTMLDYDEKARLDAWHSSQSDVATFFLDSIDELKLSLGSFEQSLKRLSKGIAGQLGRVRVVITTRPIPFDEQLVRRLLPVPPLPEIEANGDTFAQIAMHGRANKPKEGQDDVSPDWRTVALMPLSDVQIAEFACGQGVDEPKALLEDLRRRNAQEFARRPQDLIELCADWRDFKRIRTHREQVAGNIRIKLKSREDRLEAVELSVDKAIDGASRLALAMMGTRRFTIRHSAEADSGGDDVALDPTVILSNWSAGECKALLERPLFGFASYGRVRFHHRSVAEYLAAERIKALRARGMPASALKRLIFAQTKGKIIVRPSKRPIAGWLALAEDMVFETLRDHEPAVLLTEGDPESLTLSKRSQALCSYVERYSKGGWRGLTVPHIQIHRFASPELAAEINRLWAEGIENSEMREILLNLIELGQITECSNIAHATAFNGKASRAERFAAIDALATLDDPRMEALTAEIVDDAAVWPDGLARIVVLRLFPKHLSVTRFCQILARVKEMKGNIGDLSWQLPRLIAEMDLDVPTLEALRDGLSVLVSAGLRWQNGWPHILSDRPHLCSALAATCVCGLKTGAGGAWLSASVLALMVPHRDDDNEGAFTQLGKMLAELPAARNAQLFWAADALIQSIHPITDSRERYARITFQGPARIERIRDWNWIKAELANRACPAPDRAMLLEAAMRLAPSREEWRDHIIGLKPLVADLPELLAAIEELLKPAKPDKEHEHWEIEAAKRKNQQERREAEDHTSWVSFWRKVAEQPDTAFSPEQSGNTAWNIWRAMSKVGADSRAAGWNRRFIEANFSKATADRMRLTLMNQWRKDHPTLTSERPENEKNTYLMRWQVGIAGIYAEAEDPQWAIKLSDKEAQLAARYSTIELNSLPLWMEALVRGHPVAAETTLGQELDYELAREAGLQWHSMLLQNISHAPNSVIAVFLPRLRAWLDAKGDCVVSHENEKGAAQRISQVVNFLRRHGDAETRMHLCRVAKVRLGESIPESFVHVWLPTLLRLHAGDGIDVLERQVETIRPEARSKAVVWFGLFCGMNHDGIKLTDPQFTPALLLKLLRLVYRHVRPGDDAKHDSSPYSPDERDNAESARSNIVNALLQSKGEDAWLAKLEMAANLIPADFKDRIIALAEERWAEEIDAVAFDEDQAIALDKTGEAPPSSNEAMFAIMVDRLDDLDDLLLRDMSPREAWAGFTEERVMRREIARALNHHSNGLYTIDQEAVTADEKETDIRLRSTTSLHEAIIELKLADKRTAGDLRDTLKDQLVTKYMAAESSRSGCLMITLATDRQWDHPDNGSRIGFSELVALLRDEAAGIVEKLGGTLRLHVSALDLRPRLLTEAKRTKARGTRKKASAQ